MCNRLMTTERCVCSRRFGGARVLNTQGLDELIASIARRGPLDGEDRAAIRSLRYTRRTVQPQSYIVREGETGLRACSYIMSGLAFRQKLTASGRRQIVSIRIPGDFLDLQHLFLEMADHNIQALTALDVIDLNRKDLQALVMSRPAVGRALWLDTLIEASIFREWVLNVGRRDGRGRIAHLLCEFAVRMQDAGVAQTEGYYLPITQEQLGDAVGITSVHVNRMIKQLVTEGIIAFDRRNIKILDWDGLRGAGDFSSLYLHLDRPDAVA